MKSLIYIIPLFVCIVYSCEKSAESYCQKGKLLDKSGKYAEAIIQYTKAIELNNKYFEALFLRGLDKSCLGDTIGAEVDFALASTINPEYGFNLYLSAGVEFFKSGNYNAAISNFTLAIGLDSLIKVWKLKETPKDSAFSVSDNYMNNLNMGSDSGSSLIVDLYKIRGLSKYMLGDTIGGNLDIMRALANDTISQK